MKFKVHDIAEDKPIPERFAFGIPAADGPMTLGENRNPGVEWDELPPGTRSLVLLCTDDDVPANAEDVNQEGKSLPADAPRTRFYHWVLVDLPAQAGQIAEGEASDRVVPHGKSRRDGPHGGRQGLNDYTGFMAGNDEMAGRYFGYDGPCPPWNDQRLHHYCFALYATDLARCPVQGEFTGLEVEKAIKGHILDHVSVTGTYTLNPKLRGTG